jgi:uncharacterized damage-inducible protein DinB
MTAEATDGDLPARQFGWWDMWADPDNDPREAGGWDFSGERATLVRCLRDQRLTLQMKCSGLSAEDLACRSVPPSDLSLLGLLRHMTDVERGWFRQMLAGQDLPPRYRTDADRDGAFTGAVADREVVTQAWQNWRDEVEFAERFTDSALDLDTAGYHDDGVHQNSYPLRRVLVHMIEEYARHNGHADLIRERIDGRIGQ